MPCPFVGDDMPLPQIAKGYRRMYHRTYPDRLLGIALEGLKRGCAVGKGECLHVVLSSNRPDGFGDSGPLVVFDVPEDSVRMVNETWGETSRDVKTDEIVAIKPGIKGADPRDDEFVQAMQNEIKRMGDPNLIEAMNIFNEYIKLKNDGFVEKMCAEYNRLKG